MMLTAVVGKLRILLDNDIHLRIPMHQTLSRLFCFGTRRRLGENHCGYIKSFALHVDSSITSRFFIMSPDLHATPKAQILDTLLQFTFSSVVPPLLLESLVMGMFDQH